MNQKNMPARKNKSVRSISKTGGGKSYSITLPIDIVHKLKWRERQKVAVSLRSKTITIKDWPLKKSKGRKK